MYNFTEYCANNPILTAFLIASAALTIIFDILFVIALCNSKKTDLAEPSATQIPPIDENDFLEGLEKEMVSVPKESFTENTSTQENFSSFPITEQKESTSEEIVENTVEEASTTPVITTEKTEIIQKKTTQTKKKTTQSKKSKKAQKTSQDIENNEKKESSMLLDELKDVDTNVDFYEEDENESIARYTGKWIICRILTEERSASNEKSDEDEMYFFELHASNGELLLSSEEYTSYNATLRGIETHKTNILRGNFKVTVSSNGDYVFKLLNGKNLLLCTGEDYTTRAACESAIESTKRFAETAIIDENIQDHVVKVPTENDLTPLLTPSGENGKWIISERKDVNGENVYYFELFSDTDEKLLTSEEYTTYIGAVNGIQTHKTNIVDGNFHVILTKRGDYIYKLLNKNGQLLCLGERYRTKWQCLNAVEAVKYFALNAAVLTGIKQKN